MNITKRLNGTKLDKINLERVFNFLPYPLLVSEIVDGVRTNIFVNRAFEEEIGFPLSEIPTLNKWFETAYGDAIYRSQVACEWKRLEREAYKTGADAVIMQAKVNTKLYGAQWYEVKASVHGEIQFVAFVNIDKEIRKEEEMQRLIKNKDSILSILSHDLRSPLGNLCNVINLTLDGNLTEDERNSLLLKLNQQIFQMREFLDTTLHWSRSSFEETKVTYVNTDVGHSIASILGIYNDSIANKQIKVNIQLHTQSILTDEGMFNIIIRNLISNAIKFTPTGGDITIRDYIQNDWLIVEVQNSGIGINPEKIDAIMLGNYISEKGTGGENGLGLGLKLCIQFIAKLKGKLSIESTAVHSTFRIMLPTRNN
jgi:signal transduction histidine kinase